jgi:hypothetical protein
VTLDCLINHGHFVDRISFVHRTVSADLHIQTNTVHHHQMHHNFSGHHSSVHPPCDTKTTRNQSSAAQQLRFPVRLGWWHHALVRKHNCLRLAGFLVSAHRVQVWAPVFFSTREKFAKIEERQANGKVMQGFLECGIQPRDLVASFCGNP